MVLTMRKGLLLGMAAVAVLASACSGRGTRTNSGTDDGVKDSVVSIEVKYATGFSVRDSADVRLVEVGAPTPLPATAPLRQGGKYHFALVHSDDLAVPEGYTKVRVPITNTICMTALQLSNFTILDAHDVVKGYWRPILRSSSSHPRNVAAMMPSRRQASRWCHILVIRS